MEQPELAVWFARQFQASLDGFCWAIEQMPIERRDVTPGPRQAWTAARHAFHLLQYERFVALPSMRQWLGAALPDDDAFLHEDEAWTEGGPIETTLPQLRAVRAEQIALLPKFPEGAWRETREAVWGPVTLLWVATKTYQHTCEHTHGVLSMHLFWDYGMGQ
jgi:hypothetical protein